MCPQWSIVRIGLRRERKEGGRTAYSTLFHRLPNRTALSIPTEREDEEEPMRRFLASSASSLAEEGPGSFRRLQVESSRVRRACNRVDGHQRKS